MKLTEYNNINEIGFKFLSPLSFSNVFFIDLNFAYANKEYNLKLYNSNNLLLLIENNFFGEVFANKVYHAKDFDFIFVKDINEVFEIPNKKTIKIDEIFTTYKLGILSNV